METGDQPLMTGLRTRHKPPVFKSPKVCRRCGNRRPANFMMSLKQAEKYGDIFFLTIKSVNGLPVILNERYYKIILDSLKFCRENKGLKIYAYTILLNHMHLVVMAGERINLSEAIGDFKKFTANQIFEQLKLDEQFDLLNELRMGVRNDKNSNCRIWRKDCFPKTIETENFFLQKVNYIDLNAAKHNVVKDIEEYPYTSYHNHYCNHKVVLEIDDIKELL